MKAFLLALAVLFLAGEASANVCSGGTENGNDCNSVAAKDTCVSGGGKCLVESDDPVIHSDMTLFGDLAPQKQAGALERFYLEENDEPAVAAACSDNPIGNRLWIQDTNNADGSMKFCFCEGQTERFCLDGASIDVTAHGTEGQQVCIKEGTDDGGSSWCLKVPDGGGLTGTETILLTLNNCPGGELCIPATALEQGAGSTLDADTVDSLSSAALLQDVATDSGTVTDAQSLTIAGGTNVNTSASGTTITVDVPSLDDADASTTNELQDFSGDTGTITDAAAITVAGGTNVSTAASGTTITVNVPSLDDADASTTNELQDFTADDTNTITDPAGVTVTGGANNYTKASGTTLTVGKRFDFVDHFGAVAGGSSATNATAWASAMTAIDVAGCPVLHIPIGTFDINASRGPHFPVNCMVLEGEGEGSVLDLQGDNSPLFSEIGTGIDLTIRNLKIRNLETRVVTISGTNRAGDITITDSWFDDITSASGTGFCVLDDIGADPNGFNSLTFSRNRVTASNCVVDIASCTACTFGEVNIAENTVTGSKAVKVYSVGNNATADQGPVTITNNSTKDCNPWGSCSVTTATACDETSDCPATETCSISDVAIIRSEARQVTITGNHGENCTNTGGDWEGLVHVQGNGQAGMIAGNVALNLGNGAASCEASGVLVKGSSGEIVVANNTVVHDTGANLCAGIRENEGGLIAQNLVIGADQCIAGTFGDDAEGAVIRGNYCRNIGSSGTGGRAAIEVLASDDTEVVDNRIEGLVYATGAAWGIDLRCKDTTGSCTGLVVKDNHVSGVVSTGGSDEACVRFGLDSGSINFDSPVIEGNVCADVDHLIAASGTPVSDLVSPTIRDNVLLGADITTVYGSTFTTAEISGTNTYCEHPDVSGNLRPFRDVNCNGVKDAGEPYLGATLTELGGVTDTLEPTGGDVSGSFSGGFSVNSVQAGAVTPAGLDTTGGNAATDGPPARHFPRKVASSDAFDFETLSERLETLGLAASGGGRVCAGGSSIAGFDSSNGLICELDNDGSAAISAGRTWVIPSGTDSDTAGTVSDPCASLGQAIANTETGASGSQAFIELSSGEFQEPKRCVNHFPTICTVDANCSGFASTPYAPAECRSQIRFGRQCSHGKTDGSMCRGTCQFHSGLWCLHPNDCPKVGKCTGDGVTLCGVDADCAGPGGTCANFVVDTCSNTEFAGDGICLEDEFCATDGTTACSVASDCTATESGSCDVNTLTCIGNPEISCDNASSPDDTLCRACVGNGIVEGGETADAGNGVDELSVSCKTRSYITVRGVQFRATQIEGLVNHIDKCAIDVSNTAKAAFLDLLLRADDQGVAPLPSKGLLCSERMGTGINAFWTSLTSTIDSEFVDRNNPIHISGEGNLTWTLESIQPFNSLGVNGLTDSALLYMETARGNVSPTTGLTINGDPRFTNSVGCGAGICDSNNDGVPDASGVACNEDADCSGGGDCVQAYCASGDFGSFGGILQGGAEVAAVTNAPGHCNLSTEVACWNATDCPATESCTKDPGNGAFFYNMFDPELTIGGKDATEGADSDVHKYSGESYPTGHSYVRTWCSGGQSGCGVKAFLNSVDFRPAVPGPPDDPFLQDNDSQVVLQAGVSVGGLSVLTPQASDPTDGIEGMFWYSSASDTIKVQRSADIVSMLTTGALVGDLSDVIPGDIGDIPQWGSGGSLLGTSTFGGLLSGENVGTLANVTPGDNGDIPQWGASGALAGTSTLPVLTESLVAATNLSNVDDTTTAPVTGDRRRWDGTNWVPAPQSEYECVWIQDASAYAAASDSRLFLRFAPFTLLADPAYDVFKPATSICRLGSAGSVEFDLVARNLVSGALGTDVTSSTCTCTASGNAGGNCAGMLNGSTVPDNVALEIDMIGSPSAVPIEICVGGTMQ